MSIKQKFKSIWGKLRKKSNKAESGGNEGRDRTDAEISAEEVIEEEIFPKGRITPQRRQKMNADAEITFGSSGRKTRSRPDNSGNVDRICGKSDVTPTVRAGRSRPTNPGYKMIDPSDDSADSSKS